MGFSERYKNHSYRIQQMINIFFQTSKLWIWTYGYLYEWMFVSMQSKVDLTRLENRKEKNWRKTHNSMKAVKQRWLMNS